MRKMDNPENIDVSKETDSDLSDVFSMFSNIAASVDTSESSLLSSLRPYLNKKRQKKIDQCEKFIMLAGAIKLMNEIDSSENQKE